MYGFAFPLPCALRRQAGEAVEPEDVSEVGLSKEGLRMKTCEDMFEKIVDYVEGELTSQSAPPMPLPCLRRRPLLFIFTSVTSFTSVNLSPVRPQQPTADTPP